MMKELLNDAIEEIVFPPSVEIYAERLDNPHLHVWVTSLRRMGYPSLFLMGDMRGRKMLNLSVEDPFDRCACVFRIDPPSDLKAMVTLYKRLFEQVDVLQAGIFRLPLKVKVLVSSGDESWLEKLILQEKIRGEEYFSFQEKISEPKLKKLFDSLKLDHKVILKNEGVDVFLRRPTWLNEEFVPLMHEVGVLLRKRYGLIGAQNPPKDTFLSLRVSYETFLRDEFSLVAFLDDFLEKLRRIYIILLRCFEEVSSSA